MQEYADPLKRMTDFHRMPYKDHYRSAGVTIERNAKAYYNRAALVVTVRLWRWEFSVNRVLRAPKRCTCGPREGCSSPCSRIADGV